jgi:hypothetical protein
MLRTINAAGYFWIGTDYRAIVYDDAVGGTYGTGDFCPTVDYLDSFIVLTSGGNYAKVWTAANDGGGIRFVFELLLGPDTTGVFRPTNGKIYLKSTNATGFADAQIVYGIPGDLPVTGDWNGDGVDTIGVYRNGKFYLRNANTTGTADIVFAFGQAGDLPIAGDWNNDGTDTIGVYRSSIAKFFLRNTNDAGAADAAFILGNPGDKPIAGDWNADGVDTTGVFRPTNGKIYLSNVNAVSYPGPIVFGIPGDLPTAGDWDGDGVDTIGVYRNGRFLLRNTNTTGVADLSFLLGVPGDLPLAGKWGTLP